MPIPVITELKIESHTSTEQIKAIIRNSIAIAGFGSVDYDTFDDYARHWIIEYIWDASKPKGKIYIDFSLESYSYQLLRVQLFNDWDILTHSGTTFSRTVQLDLTYNSSDFNFPLDITVINHPEIKGFIWKYREDFGSLYFAQPKYIYEGFGYDDVNFSWFFVADTDFSRVVGTPENPFQDAGERNIELCPQLSFRNFKSDPPTHQVVPSPRIISPAQVGFLGAFSEDVCLMASNGLPWTKIVTIGIRSYLLLRPRPTSGIALKLN